MTLALVSGMPRFDLVTIGNADRLSRLRDLALGQHRVVAHLSADHDSQSARNILGARLDRVVSDAEARVMLIAEGAGCFAAAWWARLTPASYVSRVAGAVFYAPVVDARAARAAASHFASPKTRLPFPSLLIDNRDVLDDGRVDALAIGWGSRPFGMVGEADTPWRRARRMVTRFTAGIVELDTLRADKLRGTR